MRRTFCSLLLIAGVGLAASSTSFAADLGHRQFYKAPPVLPTFSWTGFYVGAHVGYGWGSSDWNVDGVTNTLNADGFIGGGQVGYNWQVAPNWVLGLEGDISGSGMSHSGACNLGAGSCSNDINWLATIAGRVGYSFDHALLYAKGGAAFIDQDLSYSDPQYSASSSDTRAGWMLGAGLEYAFAPAWSAKAEYNHMDFGSKTVGPYIDANQTVDALKVGVNYRFLGGLGGF